MRDVSLIRNGRRLQARKKRVLTVPEVADKLGISVGAAWKRVYRGLIPHRRLGRRVLILTDELE